MCIDEEMDKDVIVYINTVEYYSDIKKQKTK